MRWYYWLLIALSLPALYVGAFIAQNFIDGVWP